MLIRVLITVCTVFPYVAYGRYNCGGAKSSNSKTFSDNDCLSSEELWNTDQGCINNDCLIAVIAYNRPQYISKVLSSLDANAGRIEEYTVLFFIEPLDEGEGTQHETLRLAHRWAALHNHRNNRTIDDSLSDDDDTYESAAENNRRRGRAEVILNSVRKGCHANKRAAVAEGFRRSDFVILIEDDTPIAADALSFFEWAKVKYADNIDEVFSVSAFGDTGRMRHVPVRGDTNNGGRYAYALETVPPTLHFAAGRRTHFTPWVWGTWRNRYDELGLVNLWRGRDAEFNYAFRGIEQVAVASSSYTFERVHVDTSAGRHSGLRGHRAEVFPILSRANNIGQENSSHAGFGWTPDALARVQYLSYWAGETSHGPSSNITSVPPGGAFWEISNRQTAMIISRTKILEEQQEEGATMIEASVHHTLPGAHQQDSTILLQPFFLFGKDTSREICGKKRDDLGVSERHAAWNLRPEPRSSAVTDRIGNGVDKSADSDSNNPKICRVAIVAPLDVKHLFELEWLSSSMLAPLSPCVVERYFGGVRNPPRGTKHMVLVFSRVSPKTMLLDPVTRHYRPQPRLLSRVGALRSHGVKVTAVHLSDEGCWDDVDWYSNFDHVFRNYVCGKSLDLHNPNTNVRWFPLGVLPHFARNISERLVLPSTPPDSAIGHPGDGGNMNGLTPASQRHYFCNFLGQSKRGMRDREILLENVATRSLTSEAKRRDSNAWAILAKEGQENAFKCAVRTTKRFNEGEHSLYREVLEASTFTLCPSGTNEETFRVWESLEAGSIPILKRNHVAFGPLNESLSPYDPTHGLWRGDGRSELSSQNGTLAPEAVELDSTCPITSHGGISARLTGHPLPMLESWSEVPVLLREMAVLPANELDELQNRVRSWYLAFKQHHAAAFANAIEEQRLI